MRLIPVAYHQYIASPAWRKKRLERLEFDDYKCFRCPATEQLEVHHIAYERLGRERLTDMLTLCHDCHAKDHGRDPTLPVHMPDAFFRGLFDEKMALEAWQEVLQAALAANAALDELFTWADPDNFQTGFEIGTIRARLNALMQEFAGRFGQEWAPETVAA